MAVHGFMQEYWKGTNGSDAIIAVAAQRASKRHRDPNDSRSRQVEAAMSAAANQN